MEHLLATGKCPIFDNVFNIRPLKSCQKGPKRSGTKGLNIVIQNLGYLNFNNMHTKKSNRHKLPSYISYCIMYVLHSAPDNVLI